MFFFQVPAWLRWIGDVNFFRYAFDALVMTEFKGQVYKCGTGQCPAAAASTTDCVILRNGEDYYDGDCFIKTDRDLNPDDYGLYVFLIFLLGVCFKICACGVVIKQNGI